MEEQALKGTLVRWGLSQLLFDKRLSCIFPTSQRVHLRHEKKDEKKQGEKRRHSGLPRYPEKSILIHKREQSEDSSGLPNCLYSLNENFPIF